MTKLVHRMWAAVRQAMCRHQATLDVAMDYQVRFAVICPRCGWTRATVTPPQALQVQAMVRAELARARFQALQDAGKVAGLTRAELLEQRTRLGLLWGGKGRA